MRTPTLLAAAGAFVLLPLTAPAFEVIEGEVFEFTGPDDLLLEPATNVIAVNIFSTVDLDVNGVTFQNDGGAAGIGTAENDGVTVTASAANQIPDWATPPAFTGGSPESAANLATVLASIRWEPAPNPLTVDIEGLAPNALYDIQLLFNEGDGRAGNNRRYDIAIDGTLVVDDFSSQGGDGFVTAENSYAYKVEFDAGADGTLNVVLQDDIGGDPFTGADGNPILQGVIVHRAIPPMPPTDILLDPDVFPASAAVGETVGILTAVDPNGEDTHSFALVSGEGDTHNGMFQIDGAELQTAADFSAMAGNTFTIRVETEDDSGFVFTKAIEVTANADADGDGLLDNWELMFAGALSDLNGNADGPGPGAGTGDFDADGSTDAQEFANSTNPVEPDTDSDGRTDGEEAADGTNPLDEDTDGDGLNDGEEAAAGTNPLEPDTDGDTLTDAEELNGDPSTDPTMADTDGDGANDNVELELGTDPNDPNDVPSDTTVIVGEVIEFKGPDDLHLDPATAVIAVNVFGAAEGDVNGVTFLTDGGTPAVGVATNEGVSVTTTRVGGGDIPGWAAAPAFTGEDATSAANLASVMESIRWEQAPNPLTVDIEGLAPNALYEIQLLFNEGGDRNRHWDIAVEDELVVDNITSEGLEMIGVWAPDNSFAYVGEFNAPEDGILNIIMQQHIGGIDPTGTDNNPILQGVVVHLAAPGAPFIITDIVLDTGAQTATITWNSIPGANYAVDLSFTLGGEVGSWIELDDGVVGEGEQTSFTDVDVDPAVPRFYRVRQL